MSRLPIVNFKTMEKVLLRLGFEPVRRKGATSSTVILMVGQQRYPIIRDGTWPAH